jgi:hypothetical protein
MINSPSQSIPSGIRENLWIGEIDRLLRESGYIQSLNDTSIFKNHPTIVALSDYGGYVGRCRYCTYAFLYAGWRSLERWHIEILQQSLGNLKIKYSNLRQGRQQKALREWLELADKLPGHLLVIAVDKRIRHLFRVEGMGLSKVLEVEDFPGYSDDVAERTARVLHMLCYFAHFMAKPCNRFFWKTDEDGIAGSGGESIRKQQLGKLFRRILNLYIAHPLEKVGYAVDLKGGSSRTGLVYQISALERWLMPSHQKPENM